MKALHRQLYKGSELGAAAVRMQGQTASSLRSTILSGRRSRWFR